MECSQSGRNHLCHVTPGIIYGANGILAVHYIQVYPEGQGDKQLRREPVKKTDEHGIPSYYDSVEVSQ